MNPSEIAKFLRSEIEPLPDNIYGNRYRVSARLEDGTFLPCVIFQSKQRKLDLALRRIQELQSNRNQFVAFVEVIATRNMSVNDYDLRSVERSRFAWPMRILQEIHGETVMAWTAFVVEMSDGKMFSFGTSFLMEFFDLPEGYTFNEIKTIHSGVYFTESNGIQPFTRNMPKEVKIYTHRPFFTCYIDGIDT